MRWFIHSIRNRGDERGMFQGSIPAPDNRSEAELVIEKLISVFPHSGYNEEQDYWWARDDDEPMKLHRWVLRDEATDLTD
jgi:hypothetical protein